MNNITLKVYMVSTCFRLVEKINRSVGQDHESKMQIGVLDIYGFECFKFNRLLVILFTGSYISIQVIS